MSDNPKPSPDESGMPNTEWPHNRCPQCGTIHPLIEQLAAHARELRADAERYTGIRALKYKMYVADARSFGPQMTWQAEEVFNATYDERADTALAAREVKP